MPISVSLIKKLSEVEPPLRDILFAILEEFEKERARWEEEKSRLEERLSQQVTKAEFAELRKALEELSRKVAELAEAQKRTEERLDRLEAIVAELAEAQKRTEKEIAKLARGLQRTRKELGGLSRTVAYALENEAYRYLPSLLKVKYGLEIKERIIRTYVAGEEINIFARAKRNGKELTLVGESVLKLDDATKLRQVWKKVEVVKEELGGEVQPIIVTHFAKPEILERAKKAGIIVVQSFEWI